MLINTNIHACIHNQGLLYLKLMIFYEPLFYKSSKLPIIFMIIYCLPLFFRLLGKSVLFLFNPFLMPLSKPPSCFVNFSPYSWLPLFFTCASPIPSHTSCLHCFLHTIQYSPPKQKSEHVIFLLLTF